MDPRAQAAAAAVRAKLEEAQKRFNRWDNIPSLPPSGQPRILKGYRPPPCTCDDTSWLQDADRLLGGVVAATCWCRKVDWEWLREPLLVALGGERLAAHVVASLVREVQLGAPSARFYMSLAHAVHEHSEQIGAVLWGLRRVQDDAVRSRVLSMLGYAMVDTVVKQHPTAASPTP